MRLGRALGHLLARWGFVRSVLVLVLLAVWVRVAAAVFLGSRHAADLGMLLFIPVAAVFLLRRAARRGPGAGERGSGQPAFFLGSHPVLPRNSAVRLAVVPKGVLVRSGRAHGELLLRLQLIRSVSVEQVPSEGDNRARQGVLRLEVQDSVSRATYTLAFLFDEYDEAADFYEGITGEQYRMADAPWAAWRSLDLTVDVTEEELRKGFRRRIAFTRLVACPCCGGIEGIDPGCRTCGGRGSTPERDSVELAVPAGTPAGKKFVFPGMGNEDPNGRRGPLTVWLSPDDPAESRTGTVRPALRP